MFAVPGEPCGDAGPIPGTAGSTSSVVIDAVGDGVADDTVTAYLDAGDWTIRLETGGGFASGYDVTGVGPGQVAVLGAVQLDGEPGDQFLAAVGSSASTVRIGAFGVDGSGCLVRFTDPGGTSLEFEVGGSIGGLHGLACGTWEGAGHLESLSAVDVGDEVYHVYGTTWHRTDVDVLAAEGGTHILGQTFGDVEWVANLDCPGVTL